MKAVLQRVSEASVKVDGAVVGSCGAGLMILLGVAQGDSEEDARLLATKIANLRIFCDDAGKMNLSVKDIGGGVLVVSNFTLLADYAHGNRPSYFGAAAPDRAEMLYLDFVHRMQQEIRQVEKGVFGADMKIDMEANGPVTIVMDSEVLKNKGKGKQA